jgi:hypothetical protein
LCDTGILTFLAINGQTPETHHISVTDWVMSISGYSRVAIKLRTKGSQNEGEQNSRDATHHEQ